jgi:hypothetical protein
MFEEVVIVGDLDGDGIDDAMVQPRVLVPDHPDADILFLGTVHVLYGGSSVSGELTLEDLPSLTDIGAPASWRRIVRAGDVDGDGLADVLIEDVISAYLGPDDDPNVHGGAFLIYGSTTRLTGATRAADAGVWLRDPRAGKLSRPSAKLGDLDGDGKADIAITMLPDPQTRDPAHTYVLYGRSPRLTGTIDIPTIADAELVFPQAGAGFLFGVGDTDGDGHDDFFAGAGQEVDHVSRVGDLRLVRGQAQRMAGAVALADLPQSRFATLGDDFYTPPVAPLGDLDGDGIDDFALLGVPPGYPERTPDGPFTQGVFYGRHGGFAAEVTLADADATLLASTDILNSATQLASGDLDGDGRLDLVMTDASRHDADGTLYILHGTGTRLSGKIDAATAGQTLVGSRQRLRGCQIRQGRDCVGHERVGTYLSVGDLTGDGRADALVSAPWYNFVDLALFGDFGALSRAYVISSPGAPKP